MHVRFARHTDRLGEVVSFYRDRLGLPEIDRFTDHEGYDGVFLELPGSGAHLEFTTGGGHDAPSAHPETLLVLYLGSEAAVDAMVATAGVRPVEAANPYWERNAVTIADPDGWRVVLVPSEWNGAPATP